MEYERHSDPEFSVKLETLAAHVPRWDLEGHQVGSNFNITTQYVESLKLVVLIFCCIGALGLLMALVISQKRVWNSRGPLTRKANIAIKVGFVIVSLAAVGSIATSILLHKSLLQLNSALNDGVELVRQKQNNVVTATIGANLTVLLSGDVLTMVSASNKVEDYVETYFVEFAIIEGIRFAAMGAMSMIIMVGCVFMAITRPLWGRWLLITGGVVNAIIWAGIGLHTVVGLVSADLCYVLDDTPKQLIIGPVAKFGVEWGEARPYVDYFLYCNSSQDPFSAFMGGTYSLLDVVEQKLNETITERRSQKEIDELSAHVTALRQLVKNIGDLLSCVDVSQSLSSMKQTICTKLLTTNFIQLCCLFGMGVTSGIFILVTSIHTLQSWCRARRRSRNPEYVLLQTTL